MANPAILPQQLPAVRGRYTANAPLGAVGWFRAGGVAEILYKPADLQDLQFFLAQCPADIPVTVLGLLSNTIIRDGGVAGVVIRLGREFTGLTKESDGTIHAGAALLDAHVADFAAEQGITGLEFLCGIPGSIGGAIAMNAGAYGRETKDVMVAAQFVDRTGHIHTLTPAGLNMSYRHSEIPEGWIATGAVFKGTGQEDPAVIQARMTEIKEKRAASQPIRSQTGGSTFANPYPEEIKNSGLPEGTKVWQLIDQVGGRGLTLGGAQISEMHTNFMINTGGATGADLENLGEEIRKRVKDRFGITLRWEIKRFGTKT